LSIFYIRWTELTKEQKNKYRKEFNALSEEEYSKYDDVADYAFYAIK
jgi:hypothetical protein